MRRARRADYRTIWTATFETVWNDTPAEERARLDRAAWEKHFRKKLEPYVEGGRTEAWVAEDPAGTFLGYLLVGPGGGFLTPETHAFVYDVWVAPGRRREGIGVDLLRWADAWARERGYRKIKLEVAESNVVGRSLYEKLGFRAERHYMGKALDGTEDGPRRAKDVQNVK